MRFSPGCECCVGVLQACCPEGETVSASVRYLIPCNGSIISIDCPQQASQIASAEVAYSDLTPTNGHGGTLYDHYRFKVTTNCTSEFFFFRAAIEIWKNGSQVFGGGDIANTLIDAYDKGAGDPFACDGGVSELELVYTPGAGGWSVYINECHGGESDPDMIDPILVTGIS